MGWLAECFEVATGLACGGAWWALYGAITYIINHAGFA